MHTVLLVMIKPLVLAVAGLLVWAIFTILDRLIPEGRIKRFLFKPRGASARMAEQEARLASMLQPRPEAEPPGSRASRPR